MRRRYCYWRDGEDGLIPLWFRVAFFPLMLVGFFGVVVFTRLLPWWWGPGWWGALRESPLVFWHMVVHGTGETE